VAKQTADRLQIAVSRYTDDVAIFVTICCRLTAIHQRSVSARDSLAFIAERRHWSTFALCRVVIGQLTQWKGSRDSAFCANFSSDDRTMSKNVRDQLQTGTWNPFKNERSCIIMGKLSRIIDNGIHCRKSSWSCRIRIRADRRNLKTMLKLILYNCSSASKQNA